MTRLGWPLRSVFVILVALAAGCLLSGAAAASTPTPGDVFIADYIGGMVVEEPAGGGAQTTAINGLNHPAGLAVDAQEDVYVADPASGQVVEQPAGGGPQTTVGTGLSTPSGVAVDAAGDVFIADSGNNRVVEVPAGSGPQTTVGTGLNHPEGVAVDASNDVFIADHGNNRVVEVPAGGGPQTTVGTGLSAPQSVEVDSRGDVFIADTGNSRIVEVPAGGGSQTTVGTGLTLPTALAIDAQGGLYIADAGAGDVVKVPAGGGAQSTVGSVVYPEGVAAYAPPPTFSADSPPNARKGTTYTYTYVASVPAGEPGATFTVASGSLPPGLSLDPSTGVLSGTPTAFGSFKFSIEVENAATGTIGAQNTIIVGATPTPGDVFIASDRGVLELPAGGGQTTVGTGLSAPHGVGLSTDEDVYIADTFHNRVEKVSADTQIQTNVNDSVLSLDGGQGPDGVAPDLGDDVYIANTGASTVDEVLAGGGLGPGFGGFQNPQGVAVDSAGDVFVADTGDGFVREELANGGSILLASGLNGPTAVAVDVKGDVYIAESGNSRVIELPAGGGSQTTVGSGLSDPTGVAVDAYGNVYIADNANQVVEVPAGGGPQTTLPRPTGVAFYEPFGVAVYAPAPTFTSDSPPASAGIGTTYNYAYTAVKPPNEPVTFVVVSGSLPPGLSLNPTTGVLSGNPTTAGSYSFTVETENAATGTVGATNSVTVGASVPMHTLKAATAGNGSGTVSTSPPVISCPGTCAATFGAGTQVTLTATSGSGSTFAGWSGGGCSGTGSCTLTMSSDQAVTATFTATGQRALTVSTAGLGAGTVTSSSSGIDCGSACSANFPAGTSVTLTATPAPGSTFTGWSGAGCSGTGSCTVGLNSDHSVTATFDPVPPGEHALWLTKTGSGSGTVTSSLPGISCGTACSALFPAGTAVTLTASPAAGVNFAGWSGGGCSGTGSCALTLGSDQFVTAIFTKPGTSVPPVLSAFGASPKKAALRGRRVGGRCVRTAANNRGGKPCALPIALSLNFELNIPARVTITIVRLAPGRTVNRRCVTPARNNRTHRRCTRAVPLKGSLSYTGNQGANHARFNGSIGPHRLTAGSYQLIATATANGQTSAARMITFKLTG